MKLAFAGSPAPAVPPLEHLAASRHEVTLVVTQPAKPRGRSGTPTPTPVGAAAERLGIPSVAPRTINDDEVIGRIAATGAEALVVVAFGQILRDGVLSRWPCVNVHFSLLPAYRGAAPVERALMDGVEQTGVTIMLMDAGLDTGPMVRAAAVPVGEDDDAGALLGRLAGLGGPLVEQTLDDMEAGRLVTTPQPEEGITLAPKIGPDDRVLDPSAPADALARRVRALSPHIGATCAVGGQPFKVWRARALDETRPPGLTAEDGRLLGGTGAGTLEFLELQPPGKGRMAAADFLRGWRGGLEWEAAA